jgi:lipopolysaccharide export system permease protein
MKKLIIRKFFIDTTSFLLLTLTSIAMIIWIIQAVNYLDIVAEDGHSFKIYFFYTLLSLPKIFSRILPFIFLLSLLYTLIAYEKKNELIIYWIHGVKKKQFLNSIIVYSLIFLILQILFTTYLVPKSQDLGRSYIRSSNIDFFPSLIKEKKFVDTVKNLTIFIDEKKNNGELKNIFLKDNFNSAQSQIILAKRGNIIKKNKMNYLILYDGNFINQNSNKNAIFSFSKTEINLSNYATKSTTYPKIQELDTLVLAKCMYSIMNGTYENYNFQYLMCNPKESANVFQEVLKRVYLPLFIPIIALVSSLLIFYSKDEFNYNRLKLFLFLLGMFTIIFSEISIRFAIQSNIFASFIFIIPFVIFLFLYMIMIGKLNSIK